MGGRNKSFTRNKRAFGSHCYLLSVISIGLGDGLTVLNIITDIEYIDSVLRGTDCPMSHPMQQHYQIKIRYMNSDFKLKHT